MFTSDFLKDAESSIVTISSRKQPTLGSIASIVIIVFLAFLFVPMLLLLDLLSAIFKAFRR